MSEKVLQVMKQHLKIAEQYIEELEKAGSKADFIAAMSTCADNIKQQYPDLEAVTEEFNTLMVLGTADTELKEISRAAGDCFGRRTVDMFKRMAPFMGDAEFQGAQRNLDEVLNGNPLFCGAADDSAMREISANFANAVNAMAEKLHFETAETDENAAEAIEAVLKQFDDLAKRYAAAIKKADTSRKFVTANDAFVNGVKNLIPEMNRLKDAMKALAAQKLVPAGVTELSKSLGRTLGKELTEILRDKRELMNEPKVKKSVSKLGEILESVPF